MPATDTKEVHLLFQACRHSLILTLTPVALPISFHATEAAEAGAVEGIQALVAEGLLHAGDDDPGDDVQHHEASERGEASEVEPGGREGGTEGGRERGREGAREGARERGRERESECVGVCA